MWGFRWGYVETLATGQGNKKNCPAGNEMPFWAGPSAVLLGG